MWPLVLVPKLLSGSLSKHIIRDLFGEVTFIGSTDPHARCSILLGLSYDITEFTTGITMFS